MTLVIYGGGGHAKVVIDCLLAEGRHVDAVVDNKYTGEILGVKRFPSLPDNLQTGQAIVAIGDNAVRKKIALELRHQFTTAVHPSASISKYAEIAGGTMVLHHAVIQAGARIGRHVIVNTGAQIDHDCTIADYVHVAPGSILCGSISVGEGTLVGAGSVIRPGVKVGAWATVGSGTVIVKDVPDFAVVVGNPGRIIKYLQP